jgi:hypothetical protein
LFAPPSPRQREPYDNPILRPCGRGRSLPIKTTSPALSALVLVFGEGPAHRCGPPLWPRRDAERRLCGLGPDRPALGASLTLTAASPAALFGDMHHGELALARSARPLPDLPRSADCRLRVAANARVKPLSLWVMASYVLTVASPCRSGRRPIGRTGRQYTVSWQHRTPRWGDVVPG